MDNNSDEMQEIIQDFVIETEELLEGLDQSLLDLEERPHDLDLLNLIFRSVHTIKGAAGFLGFTQMVELTHQAEEVLNKLRQGDLVVTPGITDVILRGLGHLPPISL